MTDSPHSVRYSVRAPGVEDAEVLGRVHVQVWRETYAGRLPAAFLEELDPASSAQLWRLRIELDEPEGIVVVAAGPDGEIVGFATAGPTRDEDALTQWELYSINVLAAHHGSGVAGQLIDAALGQRPATLWVNSDNARAGHFYRRHGFTVEGAGKTDQGTGASEIRMIRRSGADER